MEMEEKNSGSTLRTVSRCSSKIFGTLGTVFANGRLAFQRRKRRRRNGFSKKNSSSLLEREKPPLRELNLLKKRKTLSTVTIIISLASFSQFYRPFHCILLLKWRFFSRSFNTFSNSKNKFLPLITRQLINKNLETASQFARCRYIFHIPRTVKP